MKSSPNLIVAVLLIGSLAGCADALTLTEKERSACDSKVAEHSGRVAKGEDVLANIHNKNGTKSIRIIYQKTSDFPSIQCDMYDGKVVSIVKFETLYSSEGNS